MNRNEPVTFDTFRRDVSTHELTIHHDQGVFRHLSIRKPGTSILSYEITTWPGHLAMSGDMGTYVFKRVEDMFDFFPARTPDRISFEYVCEKLRASDLRRNDGFPRVYDEALLVEALEREADAFDFEDDETRAAWLEEAIDVLTDNEDIYDDISAHRAVQDFASNRDNENTPNFDDFAEVRLTRLSDSFKWACYAITWAIHLYKDHKQTEAEKAA